MSHQIYSKILIILSFSLDLRVINSVKVVKTDQNVKLNIAIIGAGPGGLFSAKHSLAQGHRVTVYEQNNDVGGVWLYTNRCGKNQYGTNIHTAMYEGLR